MKKLGIKNQNLWNLINLICFSPVPKPPIFCSRLNYRQLVLLLHLENRSSFLIPSMSASPNLLGCLHWSPLASVSFHYSDDLSFLPIQGIPSSPIYLNLCFHESLLSFEHWVLPTSIQMCCHISSFKKPSWPHVPFQPQSHFSASPSPPFFPFSAKPT